jgi:hypothetical protein
MSGERKMKMVLLKKASRKFPESRFQVLKTFPELFLSMELKMESRVNLYQTEESRWLEKFIDYVSDEK